MSYDYTNVPAGFQDLIPSNTENPNQKQDGQMQETSLSNGIELAKAGLEFDEDERAEMSANVRWAETKAAELQPENLMMEHNAFRKYLANNEDNLRIAKSINAEIPTIPVDVMLQSPANMDKAMEIVQRKRKIQQLLPDEEQSYTLDRLYEEYPEILKLSSDVDGAIAFNNIQNVKAAKNIIEAAQRGYDAYKLNSELNNIGRSAYEGKELTPADMQRIKEIKDQLKETMMNMPDFLSDPLKSVAAGTLQQVPMMFSQGARSQLYSVPAAGMVYIGTMALTKSPVAASAAARSAYSSLSRIGYGVEMFKDTVGNYYLDYKEYQDKDGKQLLTDDEARLAATIAAAGEAYLEVGNFGKVMDMLKGTPGGSEAREALTSIVANAADKTSAKAQIAYYLKKRFGKAAGVFWSEIKEEGTQQLWTDTVHNVAAVYKPGGTLETISAGDMVKNALDSMWEAVPAVAGMTAGGNVMSSSRMVRRLASAMQEEAGSAASVQNNVAGQIMIEQLVENKKDNKLAKDNPEIYNQILGNQLEGTRYENVYVDSEMLTREGKDNEGTQIFYQLAEASGKTREEAEQMISNNSKLEVPMAKYVAAVEDNAIREKLKNYISFSDQENSFAMNKRVAAEMKNKLDRVLVKDMEQYMGSVENFVDTHIEGEQERAIAKQILMEYSDPEAGLQAIRAEYEAKVNERLEPVLDTMRSGMKQGVAIVATDDGYVRKSNNDLWYSNYYKENKKAPSEKQMREIARDALMGDNPYGIITDNSFLSGEEKQYLDEDNQAFFADVDSIMETLDKLEPVMKNLDVSELVSMEGISKEGVEVFKTVKQYLDNAPGKKAKQASVAAAVMVAHHADIYADMRRQMGDTNYTALDWMKSLGFGYGESMDGTVLNQQQNINPEIRVQMDAVKKKYYGTDQWMKAPDGTATQLTEDQWLYAHTDAFKEKYGDWETLAKNTFKAENLVVGFEKAQEKIAEIRYAKMENDAEGIVATFSKKGKDKIISSVARRLSEQNGFTENEHFTVAANTPQLFKSAIKSYEGPDINEDIKSVKWFSSFCIVNSKPAVAVYLVKEIADGEHKVYTVQLTEIKKPAGTLPQPVIKQPAASADLSKNSISQVGSERNKKQSESSEIPDKVYKRSSHKEGFEEVNVKELAEKYKDVYKSVNEHGEPDFRKLDINESNMKKSADAIKSKAFKQWFGDWENGEVPKELLDENGEPKVFYHQTGNTFDTFDVRHHGAGASDNLTPFGVFLKPTADDIGVRGSIQMPLYVRMRNPIKFNNRTDMKRYLIQNVPGYAEALAKIDSVNKEFKEKYDAAVAEDRAYIQSLLDSGMTRAETREEYSKRRDIEDDVVEQWEDAENKASAEAKELVDKYFREQGYDGVILTRDQGSFGRSVQTFIALNNNQVKSAVGNNGNFDINNSNIYMQRGAENNLVAYHNITGQDLMRAIEFGGFPVPSIAIMKKDVAYDKYGEITLVGTKDMVDPQRGVPVYAKDGYTITFPKPSYSAPKISAVRKFKDKWKSFFYEIDDAYDIDRITDDYKNPDRMVYNLRDSFGFEYYYLTKVLGKNIEIPENSYTPRMTMLKNETYFNRLHDLVESVGDDKYSDVDVWLKDIAKVVEDYYDERIAKVKLQGIKNKLIEEKAKIVKDGVVEPEYLNKIFAELAEYDKAMKNPGKDYQELKFRVRRDFADIIYGKEYYNWVDEQIKELVGEGKVKIGNKLYPFTLENVTKYMVKNAGAAAEESFTFSAGKVAALASQKFKSIDEMHKAENKLGTENEFNKSADEAKEIGDQYHTELAKYQKYKNEGIFQAFDDANECLAKAADSKGYTTIAKLRTALKKNGGFKDDIPDNVLQLGVDYLKALTDTTTQYFEAKPQRAINIGEFAGAVVPSDADPKLVQTLKDAGLMVETYKAGDNADRQAATQRVQTGRDNVLFQAAGRNAEIANTMQLDAAMQLQAQGVNEKDIYDQTGWYQGMDGQWRFEIPDNLNKIDMNMLPKVGESVPLGKIYDNPTLYKAYPWLADVMVKTETMTENLNGYTDGKKIVLNKNIIGEGAKLTLIHEIQHIIQFRENFAIGGTMESVHGQIGQEMSAVYRKMSSISPDAAYVYAAYNDIEMAFINGEYDRIKAAKDKYQAALKEKNITDEQAKEINKLGKAYDKLKDQYLQDNDNYTKYRNLHGEQEARMASEKAKIATQLEQGKELYNMTEEDILSKWSEGKSEKLVEQGKQLIDIGNKMINGESVTAEEEELYDKLVESPELEGLQNILDNKLISDDEYESLQKRYSELTLKGINKFNAIVVFGGEPIAGLSLNQNMANVKGYMRINEKGQRIVNLLQAADQSTFMHEMAHIFYDDLKELAQDERATEQISRDWKTLYNWASWSEDQLKEYEGTASYNEFKERHNLILEAQEKGYAWRDGKQVSLESLLNEWAQERFARGFEVYLETGKAPSKPLQSAFSKFKQWLMRIYKAVTGAGAKPSKEVREVMDRMIATQEEIDTAMEMAEIDGLQKQGLFRYLNETSQEMWERNLENIREDISKRVFKIAMRDMTDKAKEERAEAIKKERVAATERISQEPLWVAWKFLQQNPNLSTSDVVEQFANMTVEEYAKQLRENGGSLDGAVDQYMEVYEKQLPRVTNEEIKAAAKEAVANSYYTKLATAFELQALEQYAKDEKRLAKKLEKIQATDEKERAEEEKAIRNLDQKQREQEERDRRIRTLAAEQKENERLNERVKNLELQILDLRKQKKDIQREARDNREARLKEVREQKQAVIDQKIEKLQEQQKQINEERKRFRLWETEEGKGKRIYRDALDNYVQNIEKYAERKMSALPISDATNPAMWSRMAENYTNTSLELFARGEYELAARQKRISFFYRQMAELAEKNRAKVEKRTTALMAHSRTMLKNKNVAANDRYLYNHLMYQFGLANRDALVPPDYPPSWQDVLLTYDSNLELSYIDQDGNIDLPDWLTGVMGRESGTYRDGAGYQSLRMDQMELLYSVMSNIYKAGSDAKKLKTTKDVHGNVMDIDQVVGEIVGGAMGEIPLQMNRDVTGAGNETTFEMWKRRANEAHVALLKPETILRQLGEKAIKYIYDPIKQAADNELQETEILAGKIRGITEAYRDGLAEMYKNQGEPNYEKLADRDMAELRTKKKYQLGTSALTKENVLVLAFNWGTFVNRKRVMDGFNVTQAQVENVLAELNTADWNMVINVWDLFDDYWPRLQQTEANISGVVMEKQEAVPFTIVDKTGFTYNLKGGYYPIKYDRVKNIRIGDHAQDETARLSMSGMTRLGIGLGNTKERMETVPYKIRNDFGVIQESLTDTLHQICMRETVRDVNRIIRNPGFSEFMGEYYGNATIKMLENWVLDVWAKEPQQKDFMEKAAQWIRQKQTVAALGFRTTTALLNICNLPYVIDYLGGARTMHALTNYYAHPQAQYAMCMEKSIFLRDRAETMDRDMGDVLKRNRNNPGDKIRNAIEEKAFWLISQTDLMLACPMWISEYERVFQESMDNKMTPEQAEKEAVLAGDAAVRRTFGSGQVQDLAAVQKGSEFTKTFTMYYSFFSVVHNALMMKVFESRQANFKKEGLAASLRPIAEGVLLWMIIPAAMEACIRAAASGDDKDKEAKNVAKKFTATTVGTMVGGIPLLRDTAPAILEWAMGGRYYGVSGTPIGDVADQVQRILSGIKSSKRTKLDVLRDVVGLTSSVTGLPKTMVDGMITAMQYVDHGRPEDIMHYLWAVAFDKNPDKKKK